MGFETDSGGTITLKYVWGRAADDLLAIHTAGGTAFYIAQDLLHTPRGLVKRDGTWVLSQRFGPYGTRLAADSAGSGPGFELRYRWIGREYDAETGWYFVRARYADPLQRRFVQEDPSGYSGGSDVYAYGEGSPTSGRDVTGLRMRFIPERETINPHWGQNWQRGEAWAACEDMGGTMGFGWVNLTSAERDAIYDRYQRNYERLQEEGVYSGAIGRANAHSEMMTQDEFGTSMRLSWMLQS
ncbi:MAG TPA: RHS repeat-associated core domain-containing protein [Nitrospira sp.]|nr:RHS repeat-associated core domain-containing protein [Nitrospira sp.]